MLSIPSGLVKFGEIAITRVMMFLLFYLALEFARMFISASAATHPYMAMWGAVLFEMAVLILFSILYGDESVGRDIGTLMLYGVFIHIAYIPFYFYGIDVSMLHNNAHKAINALIVLRLVYFGGKELLRLISMNEYLKESFLNHQWQLNSYINTLTISIFVFCALPLFTLIYLINTDQMRASGIAIILVSFYIAIDSAKKRGAINQGKTNSLHIEDSENESEMMSMEESKIAELGNSLKILGAFVLVLMALFPVTIDRYKKSFFNMGYASGFSDAKSNAPPKKEANFETAVRCVMEANTRLPQAPGQGCLDKK